MSENNINNEHLNNLRDAAKAITSMGKAFMRYSLDEFNLKWKDGFLAEEMDPVLRIGWIRSVSASPYAAVHLFDKEGNIAVIVPPMAISTGNYISDKIDLSQFLTAYSYAKSYANGYRAVAMMENLAKNGVIKSNFPSEDVKAWDEFYKFYGVEPKWIKDAKNVLNKLENNMAANTTGDSSIGDTEHDGFGSETEYEDL